MSADTSSYVNLFVKESPLGPVLVIHAITIHPEHHSQQQDNQVEHQKHLTASVVLQEFSDPAFHTGGCGHVEQDEDEYLQEHCDDQQDVQQFHEIPTFKL